MADPVEIRDGDMVLVHRVDLYSARVGRLTEIKRVFRDVGVPGIAPSRLRPGPGQLRLDGVDERER